MDAFEDLIAFLLRQSGHWVQTAFKVGLNKVTLLRMLRPMMNSGCSGIGSFQGVTALHGNRAPQLSIDHSMRITALVMIMFSFLLSHCATEEEGKGAKRLFIIDDDNGMNVDRVREEGSWVTPVAKFTDPDGGLELIYALGEPDIEILGLICIFGTVSTDICMNADAKILKLMGREEIPVRRGAESPDQLGQITEAAQFIIDTVRAHPGRVEIAASGPMTNIATALMIDPELPKLWKALYIMSGEFGMGSNIQQTAALIGGDLNLSADLPAAQHVFTSAGALSVFPNELMDDVLVTTEDMNYFADSGSPVADYALYETETWFTIITRVMNLDGFWPHGMTALAAVIHPYHRGPVTKSAIIAKPDGEISPITHRIPAVTAMVVDSELPVHKIYFEFRGEAQFRADFRHRMTTFPGD